MIEFLVQVALSNALLSAALAVLAYAVHRRGRHPVLAHALWVAVLVKVITPPLVMLPIVPGPPAAAEGSGGAVTVPGIAAVDPGGSLAAAVGPAASGLSEAFADDALALLVLLWLLGSAVVLAVSVLRVRRFEGLLRRTSTPALPPIVRLASTLAAPLGLRSMPEIHVSRARVSPMTWWMGGRVRIVVPSALTERTDPQHLRWIIAHELAHVRRRDHLVRWLEWLACVTCWWNPVVWWARRKLREAEEASCDQLVLERLRGPARSYGRALLAVVEILAHPATPPLALATGIGGGAGLERRFRTILADRRARAVPRWLMACLLATTVASLSVGVGRASDGGADGDPALGPTAPVEPVPTMTAGAQAGSNRDDDAYSMVSAPLARTGAIGAERRRARRAGQPRGWDAVFVGTAGPDTYAGTPGRDLVAGRGGSDDLAGRRGRDVIRGGPDSDVLAGGRSDDVVISWRDGVSDAVDCGPGDADRAVVDPTDVVTGCEIVHRRDRAGRAAHRSGTG